MSTTKQGGPSLEDQFQVGDVQDLDASLDLPPTIIPCLDARPGANAVWQSTEIPFKDATALQSFCRRYNVSSLSILQAAWALVLRCYVGNPSICFACEIFKEAADNGKYTLPNVMDGICKAEIDGEIPVMEMVRGMRMIKHSSHSQSSGPQLFPRQHLTSPEALLTNSLIRFREDIGQDLLEAERQDCMDWDSHGSTDVRMSTLIC